MSETPWSSSLPHLALSLTGQTVVSQGLEQKDRASEAFETHMAVREHMSVVLLEAGEQPRSRI